MEEAEGLIQRSSAPRSHGPVVRHNPIPGARCRISMRYRARLTAAPYAGPPAQLPSIATAGPETSMARARGRKLGGTTSTGPSPPPSISFHPDAAGCLVSPSMWRSMRWAPSGYREWGDLGSQRSPRAAGCVQSWGCSPLKASLGVVAGWPFSPGAWRHGLGSDMAFLGAVWNPRCCAVVLEGFRASRDAQ